MDETHQVDRVEADAVHALGDGQHHGGRHARRPQRLMRVAQGGVQHLDLFHAFIRYCGSMPACLTSCAYLATSASRYCRNRALDNALTSNPWDSSFWRTSADSRLFRNSASSFAITVG